MPPPGNQERPARPGDAVPVHPSAHGGQGPLANERQHLMEGGTGRRQAPCGERGHQPPGIPSLFYIGPMVRPDENADLPCQGFSRRHSGCTFPAGASPVPVSTEAPGNRSQAAGENRLSRVGCRKPGTQSGEQVSRPQNQVNPAASTEEQWEGRAVLRRSGLPLAGPPGLRKTHAGGWLVTAKAILLAIPFGPINAWSLPGVGRATCLQGKARNRRDSCESSEGAYGSLPSGNRRNPEEI